jgi:acetyl esterase
VGATDQIDPELAGPAELYSSAVDPAVLLSDLDTLRALRSTPGLLSGGESPTDDRVHVENRSVPRSDAEGEIRVRVYRQAQDPVAESPLVLFFHGGAFVLGDLYTEELRCLRYCADAGCTVVSVDYRLAPEHPYPAALQDCRRALEWAVANAGSLDADPTRVAVAGSSAGAALAAATTLVARDERGPSLSFQLLVYPVLDDRMNTHSMRSFVDTPLWTRGSSAQMWKHYLGDLGDLAGGDEVPAYASPARATDLGGLPAAYVLTADLDPLRDEGIEYARRLMEAGVQTELHCVPRTFHGYDIVAAGTGIGRRALDEQVGALARALGTTGG